MEGTWEEFAPYIIKPKPKFKKSPKILKIKLIKV